MKQQERSWDDDIERLILFADIMGFKDRVMRTRHIDLKHTLVAFKEEWSRKMSPFKLGDHLRFSQYSDSIVTSYLHSRNEKSIYGVDTLFLRRVHA